MKIFVPSLPFNIQEADLVEAFSKFGSVETVKIVKNKFLSRSKGFGFIEMPNEIQAGKAVQKMNGAQINGRTIVVSETDDMLCYT